MTAPRFPTFEEFFVALLGVEAPYEWQTRLAEQVASEGFPDQISVPTGLGKTSVIAIWLYELARQAHEGDPRTVPMRLFYVVNRRSVVDQGDRYAKTLQAKVGDSEVGAVLEPVREALATLLPPGDDRLLVTAAIHGDSPDDKAWMRATGATVVSLTPTQLVSRTLMRGVNVSEKTRSIHAGLVGVDRLVVFDEPQLAIPAICAVKDQEALQTRAENLGVPLGQTIMLGATPPSLQTALSPQAASDLQAASHSQAASDLQAASHAGPAVSPTASFEFNTEANLENEAARARLEAPKTLEIVPTKTTGPAALTQQAKRFVDHMVQRGKERLLLVLNTVEAAQKVYEGLAKLPARRAPKNLRLMTSRFRGVDKPSVVDLAEGPLVLVATQTVEVGLDISFEALFTEAASFDALVQRLGRLNRDGDKKVAPAWVVAQATGKTDPFSVSRSTAYIYGEEQVKAALTLFETHARGGIADVSPLALMKLREDAGGSIEPPRPRAATLHGGLVPVITQTMPTPVSDIPVEAFVAGPDDKAVREVQVAWRSDLTQLDDVKKQEAAAPLPGEYVTVPLGQLRAFLEGRKAPGFITDLSDLDEEPAGGRRLEAGRGAQVRVLNPGFSRWLRISDSYQIQPGAKVVVETGLGGYVAPCPNNTGPSSKGPSSKGPNRGVSGGARAGACGLGWFPESTEPVETVQLRALEKVLEAQRAASELRDPRPHKLVVDQYLQDEAERRGLSETGDLISAVVEASGELLASESEHPEISSAAADALVRESNRLITALTGGDGIKLSSREVTRRAFPGGVVLNVKLKAPYENPEASEPVYLSVHSAQVADWAGEAAKRAGLHGDLVQALADAGEYHDAGKLWGPFQAMLGGGGEARGGFEPLAKSVSRVRKQASGPGGSDLADRGVNAAVGRDPAIQDAAGPDHVRQGLAVQDPVRQDLAGQDPTAHGLPRGWRHELQSAAYIPFDLPNRTLVSHLCVCTHGWGHPWFPTQEVPEGDTSIQDRLRVGGVGAADEYLALNERFGPWGLAYLEAVLRLADWTASANPDPEVEPVDISVWEARRDLPSKQFRRSAFPPEESGRETTQVEPTEPLGELRLEGLAQFPVTSWYASLGLLAAANSLGDEGATLRWERTGGLEAVPPTTPILKTRFGVQELVEAVVDSGQWAQTEALLAEHGCLALTVKGQKMGPAPYLRDVLLEASERGLTLLLGSLTDAEASDHALRIPLAIPAFPNNSSYPALAFKTVENAAAVERAVESLFDPNKGYAVAAVDGGLDRPEDYDPAVSGSVGKDRRLVRDALSPLVLWGMSFWGTVPPRGYGCKPSRISLPLPEEPATLAQLRALTLLGTTPHWRELGGGEDRWVLEGGKVFDDRSKQEWWVAAPKLEHETSKRTRSYSGQLGYKRAGQ